MSNRKESREALEGQREWFQDAAELRAHIVSLWEAG